jgi:hypothetical protein
LKKCLKTEFGHDININREVQKMPETSKRTWGIFIFENGEGGETTEK